MSGIEKIPLRIPPEWDKALPGFSVWFDRFVREVLAKADVRNAFSSGTIVITGTSGEPATISDSGVGSANFMPRHDIQSPIDQGQAITEMRTFNRQVQAPTNAADAQAVLAYRIFGG